MTLTLCYVADATNIHVQRVLGFFAGRGHAVYCLSDKGGQIDGVTVLELPNRDILLADDKRARKTDVIRARKRQIRQVIQDIKPDIVHAIFLYHRGWSAALANFHPLVITLLGSDIYLPQRHYRHPLQLWRDQALNVLSLRQSDMITAVSDDLYRIAMRMTMGQVPVELIPIGTSTELFKPGLDVTGLRERLGIPEDSYVVLSPRQITPHYNQEIIIQAIPRVLEEVPNAVFIMKDTFRNSREREDYIAHLKQKAEELGVAHAVRWVDEVPMEELPQYYNISDVVVSVPSTDGMPVTLFEAMACQKPVIVGDLPSYNDVVIHGQTGLRVPLRNTQVLARAVIKLAKNPAMARRLVEESQVVLHQYGVFDEQLQRMERYYKAMAGHQIQVEKGFAKWMNYQLLKLLIALS